MIIVKTFFIFSCIFLVNFPWWNSSKVKKKKKRKKLARFESWISHWCGSVHMCHGLLSLQTPLCLVFTPIWQIKVTNRTAERVPGRHCRRNRSEEGGSVKSSELGERCHLKSGKETQPVSFCFSVGFDRDDEVLQKRSCLTVKLPWINRFKKKKKVPQSAIVTLNKCWFKHTVYSKTDHVEIIFF